MRPDLLGVTKVSRLLGNSICDSLKRGCCVSWVWGEANCSSLVVIPDLPASSATADPGLLCVFNVRGVTATSELDLLLETSEITRVFALEVLGFLGTVDSIEAVTFPSLSRSAA